MELQTIEKLTLIGYNFMVVDSQFVLLQIDTSARELLPRNRALRQELGKRKPGEKHESSPRPAARDGMEQEPYEFRIRPSGAGIRG
jgi:hypothetical protein